MKLRKAKAPKVDTVKSIKKMVKFYRQIGFDYADIARVFGISRQALFNIRRAK
jgi:hypothetical protein